MFGKSFCGILSLHGFVRLQVWAAAYGEQYNLISQVVLDICPIIVPTNQINQDFKAISYFSPPHIQHMEGDDIKRLSRLIAILTGLQTGKIVTSYTLAQRFGVSVRTIYRDIKTLEQAGVPIIAEERKGYTLMEGYRIPPVMFTEREANALITAERLVLKNSDSSLAREYADAVNKIKAVLLNATKYKAELLSKRIAVSPAMPGASTSNSLALIQTALTDFKVLKINYRSGENNKKTLRNIEPFAFYYSLQENWLLIAFCQLRNDYRMFRLDRILEIEVLGISFKPHKLTLKEFLEAKQKNFTIPDIPLS